MEFWNDLDRIRRMLIAEVEDHNLITLWCSCSERACGTSTVPSRFLDKRLLRSQKR